MCGKRANGGDDDLALKQSKSKKAKPDTDAGTPSHGVGSSFKLSEPKVTERKPRLKRSNSIDEGGSPLSLDDRFTKNKALKKQDMKDFSVIAVFSREAFENFGKKWKTLMNNDSTARATAGSLKGISPDEVTARIYLQSRHVLDPDFQAHVQALVDKKTNPHVIAIIEGKKEIDSFTLKAQVDDKTIDVPYTLVNYTQGKNSNNSVDNKQSMSVYVRNDMVGVYKVSNEVVPHGTKKINAVGINYSTTDKTNYRSLIVHIPNEFIGDKSKEAATHAAFQDYADKERAKDKPVVVTSYFGDTNYSSSATSYTSPSMGGQLADGKTLNPQSSGAKKETHFIQSVPLSENDKKHSVLQPSTLNYVFINPDSSNREATDHPSALQYTAHSEQLAERSDYGSLFTLDFELKKV